MIHTYQHTAENIMKFPQKTLPVSGTRVESRTDVCGSHRAKGTVLCINEDRWSKHAVVLMDDGTTRKCESLTSVGIGWYAI